MKREEKIGEEWGHRSKYRQKMKMSAIPKAFLNLFFRTKLKTLLYWDCPLIFCFTEILLYINLFQNLPVEKKQENLCNSILRRRQKLCSSLSPIWLSDRKLTASWGRLSACCSTPVIWSLLYSAQNSCINFP